jgi:ankyrin repeat protein
MVELLLAKGAYVDPVAKFGTPLNFAASEGHYGTMKILLDHNADVSLSTYHFLHAYRTR